MNTKTLSREQTGLGLPTTDVAPPMKRPLAIVGIVTAVVLGGVAYALNSAAPSVAPGEIGVLSEQVTPQELSSSALLPAEDPARAITPAASASIGVINPADQSVQVAPSADSGAEFPAPDLNLFVAEVAQFNEAMAASDLGSLAGSVTADDPTHESAVAQGALSAAEFVTPSIPGN